MKYLQGDFRFGYRDPQFLCYPQLVDFKVIEIGKNVVAYLGYGPVYAQKRPGGISFPKIASLMTRGNGHWKRRRRHQILLDSRLS